MMDFWEALRETDSAGGRTAAWIIEGEGAGTKALFVRKAGGYTPAGGDAGFPAEVAGAAAKAEPGSGAVLLAGRRVFLERLPERKRLVLCGAGHVALCLIRLGVTLGYEVTVIEDREEFARKAGDAGAQRILCRPFGEALDSLEGGPAAAFVVMTREHAHDMECLRRILRKEYAYAGMMGSRSRSEQIRRQLADEGFDPGRLEQVHMPIGLRIGSETPAEIAVSVAAELISVLNASGAGEGFTPGMAEELEEAGKAGRPGILAMIVEKSGEAPRKAGTKMLVRPDGSFLGTVGGGYAEARILKTAGDMLRDGCREPRLVRISMQKGTMHCGGEITVFLSQAG